MRKGACFIEVKATQLIYPKFGTYTQMTNIQSQPIGIMDRGFDNGPGDRGLISGRVIPKTQKEEKVLDASLLNTHKVLIVGKWSNPGKGVVSSPWCSSY